MERKTVTVAELSRFLGFSKSSVDLHLAVLEKYHIGKYYLFNKEFLTDLKECYTRQIKREGGRYADKYKSAIVKLDWLIKNRQGNDG